jgi:hypothetical protein
MTEKTDHCTAIKRKGDVAGRSGTGLADAMDAMDRMDTDNQTKIAFPGE